MGRGVPHRNSHRKCLMSLTQTWKDLLKKTFRTHSQTPDIIRIRNKPLIEAYGQLVQLGFDITAFTPAAYQRGGLPRPF